MTIDNIRVHRGRPRAVLRRGLLIACVAILMVPPAAWANTSNDSIPKDPSRASTISLLGTLGPIGGGLLMTGLLSEGSDGEVNIAATLATAGLLSFGLIAGPGLGHSYAGNKNQLWTGVALRGLSTTGMVLSLALSWNDSESKGAALLFGACAVTMVGSLIHDLGTADRSAREYNKAHALAKIKLSPTYFAKDKAAGLTLSFSL